MNSSHITQLRTLIAKDLRQLRALRRAGFALHLVVLSVLVLLSVVSDEQGRTLFGARSPELGEALGHTAALLLAHGVWPLLALLASIQAFASDRTQAAESLLLSAPVPRTAIWSARAVAGVVSFAGMLVAGSALWILLATTLGKLDARDALLIVVDASTRSLAFQAIAFTSGAALVAFGLNALIALIGGAGLAAALYVLGRALPMLFVIDSFFGVPVFVPTLTLPSIVLIVAAVVMFCRGEPAGRGRLLRGIVSVACGGVLVVAVFLAVAPRAVRAAVLDADLAYFAAPPSGASSLLIGEENGALLIDVATGDTLRYFPPNIYRWAWNEDGTRLAVISYAGPFGTRAFAPELIVVDERGRERDLRYEIDDDFVGRMEWCGRHLVFIAARADGADVLAVDPIHDEEARLLATLDGLSASLDRIAEGKRCVLTRRLDEEAPEGAHPRYETVGVFEIDPSAGAMAESAFVTIPGFGLRGAWFLSPSGRYWMRPENDGESSRFSILDLRSGRTWSPPEAENVKRSQWLAGDVFVWITEDGAGVRKTLWVGRPDEESAEALGSWTAEFVALGPSPDRRHLIVRVTKPNSEMLDDEPTSLYFRVRADGLELMEASRRLRGRWLSSDALGEYERGRLVIRPLEETDPVVERRL
jgi:hypothetical protein